MNEIIFAIYKRKLKYPSEIKISERIVPCCVLWFLTGKPVQAVHRCYIKARLKFIWGHSNTNLFMNLHHVSIMWGGNPQNKILGLTYEVQIP